MSYDIEYARAVFFQSDPATNYVESEEQRRSSCDHFVFHKIGCNNISPRPQTWVLMAHGWPYSVVAKICEMAGHTEGGGLKLKSGDTTPESYLKLYRKAISDAKPIEEAKEALGIYRFKIYIDPKKALIAKRDDDFTWKRVIELGKSDEWERIGGEYDMAVWSRPFNTVEDLVGFANAQALARGLGGFGHIDSYDNK